METLVYMSNMFGGLALGLWVLKWTLIKEGGGWQALKTEVTRRKLVVCEVAVPCFVIFLVLQCLILVLR